MDGQSAFILFELNYLKRPRGGGDGVGFAGIGTHPHIGPALDVMQCIVPLVALQKFACVVVIYSIL